MEQLLCGPGEVFGLEPAADEWAISECSEDVAVGGIGLLFTLCFLRRRRRVAQPQRAVETAVDGSIYSALDGSDEATGLLEAEAEARGQQATIQSLAARRDAESVGKLRLLADEDIFARCETRPLRLLADALTAAAVALRAWAAVAAVLGGGPPHRVVAAVLELTAWAAALLLTRAETAARRPRSTGVMVFWALGTAAPASATLRALAIRAVGDGSGSLAGDQSASAAHLAAVAALLGLALCVLACCISRQHHRSTIWHVYQGAWSLQREGDGSGALERLLGLGEGKTGRRRHRGGGSWCPEKGAAGDSGIMSKVRRLLRLGRPDAWFIAIGVSGFITHATAKVWYQLLYGQLIDAVYNADRELATTTVLQLLLATMLASWCDRYADVFLSIGGARLSVRLQRQVFNLIMEQDAAFFDRMKTGSLMTILSTNVGSIQNVLVHQTADLAEGLTVTIILLVYMMVREWRLTLVLVASTVAPLAVQGVVGWYTEKKTEVLMRQQGKQGQVAEEQIGEVRTVKSLGHEDHAKELYLSAASATYKTRVLLALVTAPLEGIVDSLFSGSLVLCFFIGTIATLDGRLEPAFLVSFMLLANNLRDNLGKCFEMVPEFAGAIGAAARIFELVDHRSSVNYCGGAVLPDVRGELRFHDVWFRYDTRPDAAVLRGISLTIAPSQTVALVGTSGHGKSTIIDLIQRMYDPCAAPPDSDRGARSAVTLDGHDLRELEPRWLRQQLGVVRQEPALFAGSVRENIVYGLEGRVSDADITQCLRDANAHEFVAGLPQGIDTEIGERGVTLSGGQKQRVAIARALLRNPRILLLDEATSALDSDSEQVVQAALTRCMAGRTTIVVAHRLSTVENADLIVVLNHGQVLEAGTHAELMGGGAGVRGRYAELVAKQALAR